MKFLSTKYKELIVTVDPKSFVIDGGQKVTKGLLGLYPTGLSIYFTKGEFDTKSLRMSFGEEQKLIKILKNHPSYGVSFVAEDIAKEENELTPEQKQAKADKEIAAAKAADTNHDKPKNK